MFFKNYILFVILILFTHLIAMSTQAISNKKYFFGVYVDEIILEEDIKTKINKDFKKKLNISLILSIVIYIALKKLFNLNIGANIITCITLYTTFFYLILREEYKKVKIIKENYLGKLPVKNNEKSYERVIEKEDEIISIKKKKIIKKFKILFGICLFMSIISFLYVLISYKSLPDTIITHWGFDGKPDGYSKKNIINVFFVNFLDISMVILFAVMAIGTLLSPTYIDDSYLETNRKKAIKYLNGMGYSFFILTLSIQSITTTVPIFLVKQKSIPLWATLTTCILPIIVAIFLIYFYIMLSNIKPKNKDRYTVENDDEKWIYGFIYYNKEDSHLMVEKRLGMGWNMNMAHPMGKFITIIIILMLVFSLLICFI